MTVTETHLDSPGGPPRRRMSRTKKAFIIMLSLSLLILAGVIGAGLYVAREVNASIVRIEQEQVFPDEESRPVKPTPTVVKVADPVNILLLGSDSRTSNGNPAQWVYGQQRTDTIMLLHLPGDRQGAFVLSIPRDSWVKIPGHGRDKINSAYADGGPPLLIETIEDLTEIHIDHFAIADLVSFSRLTDALGGVEIPTESGLRTMNGQQAVAWARDRFTVAGGDFNRIQRHQSWIRAVAQKAFTRDVLSSPRKLRKLLKSLENSVALDEGLGIRELVELAGTAKDIRASDVVFMTAPVLGTGWSPDGRQSIVNVDFDGLEELSEAIAEDRAAEYVAEHDGDLTTLGKTVR